MDIKIKRREGMRKIHFIIIMLIILIVASLIVDTIKTGNFLEGVLLTFIPIIIATPIIFGIVIFLNKLID